MAKNERKQEDGVPIGSSQTSQFPVTEIATLVPAIYI